MAKRFRVVFFLLLFLLLVRCTKGKDFLLHTIQYRLSTQKLLTMATVNFYNGLVPAFMILEPSFEINNTNGQQRIPLFPSQQINLQKKERQQEIKSIYKSNFHKKLEHSIKVLIHNKDQIEQQCLFDEPWDLCMIQNPTKRKSLDFSIHCLLQEDKKGKIFGSCSGKFTIRQADLTKIQTNQNKYQQKIKYESGLFALPSSDKHSVMLISCQDDDLPLFSQSLKIFSNSRYHRYERENSDEIKELVGFDKNQEIKIQNPLKNDQKDSQKSKQLVSWKDQKFFYLDVKEQMVRKCLQFEFYASNKIVDDKKVFDFMNLTDNDYKNVYSIVKSQFEAQPKRQISNDQHQDSNPKELMFKYNMQLTLNIFKPMHILQNESYDIRVKLINPQKKSTIISYTFPFAINNESVTPSTALYSRSNHYHFSYIIGHEVIKDFSFFEVEVEFDARYFSSQNNQHKNSFFFITLNVEDAQNILVEKLMTTYLSVKKDEHLTFLLEEPYEVDQIKAEKNSKYTDLVRILPSQPDHMQIKMSEHSSDHDHTTECHFSKGCKFQLDTLNDCLQCKIEYKTSFIRSPNDILMLEIKQTIFEGKIDLDQVQYFYKELKPSEVVQLIVNTPNIIVYTLENPDDLKKCKIPKKSCHSQVVTSHDKVILFNSNRQHTQLIFVAVEGLDKTRFSILLLASEKIVNVINGIPFTYKLPAKKNEIQLLFQLPSFEEKKSYESSITFNLIAPLNSLEMDILQLKDDGTELEALEKSKTMAGFIKLSSKDIKSRKIKIILSKTTHYLNHWVHFTLIVSTSDHKFRLDTGITHYETFDSAEQKTFVIEFEDRHTYELNIHFYDTPQEQISFTVAIFNPNEVQGSKKALNYKINSKQWVIVLDDELVDKNDLCPQNDPECTVFVMVSSMMAHEVEIAMTLLTADSVMELKDGVWQTFQLDDLLMRTHFYFTPTHDFNPVKIFFKSSKPDIFLTALLYDNSENVNPAEWPFPQTHKHSTQENFQLNQNYLFKSNHLIQLDNEDSQFKKCFPHCVVLLSIFQREQGRNIKTKQTDDFEDKEGHGVSFSILASNNPIELPQKLRLTLELKKSEQQLIFIDLKHAFKEKRQLLTFFSNLIVGYAQIYAKVYLPSLQNIPDQDDYDFLFDPIKTQVSLDEIRDIFVQSIAQLVDVASVEDILEKEELYLTLFIIAEEPTKLTLEYTTDYQEITELSIDSVETVSLEANQQKLFQFYPTRDQKIRFIRTKGYPLFHQFKCDADEGGYDNCLKLWLQKLKLKTEDDIRSIRKEREIQKQLSESPLLAQKNMSEMAALSQQQQFSQYQILKKTQTQHIIECQRCIIFIWIYAIEPSELTIQLQSLNTEMLIKQNELVADYVESNQYHRYYLPRVQKEFTSIIVSVNEGSPIVTVTDNLNFNQTKKASQILDDGRKVLLFTVPPVKQLPKQKALSHKGTQTSSFNKIFSNLHISITPENSKPVSYTLSYSSGTHEMFLKNGVISSQFLFENQNTTFYYKNQKKSSKSYLTLTVEALPEQIEEILNGIEIKMFSLEMDTQKGVSKKNQLASEQPFNSGKRFKKHTTLTYEIPPFDDLQINIFSRKTTKITIGLTNGQIIFLPLNYEYPVFLEPREEMKFVVDNLKEGEEIEFLIKKCDQSNPYIFYTMEEKEFQKNLYSNYDKFGSESVFKHVSKTKEKASLYIKLKADPKQSSTLIIKANYVFKAEQNFVDLDPGNIGLISYQFENLQEINLNFTGLACGNECAELTEYYLIRGKSLEKVYNELVCAGQQMIKLFEKKKAKDVQTGRQDSSKGHKQSMLSGIGEDIEIQKINTKPSSQNQFFLIVPVSPTHPILTIKVVYKPTGQETYYKPIEVKTIQSSFKSYNLRILVIFAGLIVIGLILLLLITRKLARRGYVHVGQDQTMVV